MAADEAYTDQGEDPEVAGTVRALCADFDNRPDALIEILHGVQAAFGFVPEAAVGALAKSLNLSRADVHGVISFYHDFAREKPGRHVLKLCRAESCQANGSNALAAHAESALGVPFGATTGDGEFTLKAVYCLGNCALGPSVLVGETLHARVDAAKFDDLVAGLRGAKG
ncbi:MAG: formate dehydrogenase subunit gamma [Alphaproteobacteria bacterium]|nr:formate dehydrogenase subunit gamma [Alphaproteobacteria bacterium]